MNARVEQWGYDEDGRWGLLSVSDNRTLDETRRRRRVYILTQAYDIATARIEARGYPPLMARPLAAMLLYQELPPDERQTLQDIADTVATKAKQRLQAVDDATTNDEVDGVEPDSSG